MASDYIEDLRLRIIAEAQEANATIETVGKKILELAKVADVPIKIFANTVKDMAGLDSEFNKLIDDAARYATAIDRAAQAQEKLSQKSIEKVSQLQAVQQVDANDAAYAQRLANQEAERKLAEQRALAFGKEMEQVNKLDADLKQLDARLKNGTATIKEYSTALASMIKPSTITATQNIAPNLFNKDTVAQVKRTMAEIQAITKLEAGKVAAIMKTMFPNIDTRNIEAAKRSLQGIEPAANKAGKGLWSLKNMARTALGTFEAMAIFFVTRFIGQAINKTIDSLKQLELAFYKIGIAEKSLSKAGVDIAPSDLKSISDEIKSTFDYISEVDSLKMVSNLALLTKDLRLTKDQLLDLAKAIPVLATSADISVESATDQVIAGLTKSGRGWADLGITVDAAIIKQQAIKDGLVESEAAYNELTAEQKQHVEVLSLISILNNNVADSLKEQGSYMETVTGKTRDLSGTWENFTTVAGVLFAPAIKAGLDIAVAGVDALIKAVEIAKQGYMGFMGALVGSSVALRAFLDNPMMQIDDFRALLKQATYEAMHLMDESMAPTLGQDTPTGVPPVNEEGIVQPVEDIQGALDKMNNEILEAQIKLGQDMEEAALDWNRKLEDIAIEYAKKRADAELDYANKVRDIVSSYNDKIASINLQQAESNEKARNDELEREAKFQEQMRQLKEKFLMSLDDALHARDARQILRLIAQYNLDKAQAEREHALDKESAKRDQEEKNKQFARERADAERERNQKLEEARQEYQDKLLQLEINEKAEREAADLAYKRKMEDLDREMKDKLELVAAGLIQEFNLTRNGMDAILNLYKSYYSQISEIYAAMNRMLSGTQVAVPSTTRANGAPVSIGGGKRYAEGGIAIADRPTNAVFGERGLEMATFTPLNRAGRDVNTIFSSLSSSGEPSSTSTIQIMLSKDLEGRIVDNALNHTANIILSTMRE